MFLVLHKDHKGLNLTTYEPSKPNMGLQTLMNAQQISDILNLNLPLDQDPSEQLTSHLHHQDHSKLQFDLFRTLDYHLNNTETHQNPPELKSELSGLNKNVDPRCLRSRENTKNIVLKVLVDSLYY